MKSRRLTLLTATVAGLLMVGAAPAVAALHVVDYATACANPTRTITSNVNDALDLSSNDVLLITGTGNFKGGINSFPSGAVVCIDTGGGFDPKYMNNAAGAIANRGDLSFGSVSVNAGFTLINEGTAKFNGSFNINGAAIITNAVTGTVTNNSQFSPSSGAQLNNDGTWTAHGGLNLNGGASLTNTGEFDITGNSTVDGVLTNTGTLTTGGVNVNGGATVSNSCLWQASGDLITNSPSFTNAGLVTLANRSFTNQGRYTQTGTGLLEGGDFTNNQAVTGLGRYRFTTKTVTQGTFVGDSAANPIVFDDESPTGPIFDQASGTVSNVVRGTVPPPLSGQRSSPTCSSTDLPIADVITSKTGPATVGAGAGVTYTVTVRNAGPADAADVVVRDELPSALTGVSASDGGIVTAADVTWNAGTVASGQTLTYAVTGTAPAAGTLHDVVSSTSTTSDPDPTNNDGSSTAAAVSTEVVPAAPVNHPPRVNDSLLATTVNVPVSGSIEATESDEGQVVTFTKTTLPTHGTMVLSPSGAGTYVPDAGFAGVDSFTVQGCDNGTPILCDSATATIHVYPSAGDNAVSTTVGTPVSIDVSVSDVGTTGPPSVVTPPDHGTAELQSDGTYLYTPAPAFVGVDTFVYRICTETTPALCASATVSVDVQPAPNNRPHVDDQAHTTEANTAFGGVLLATDPDADQTLSFSTATAPLHGTLHLDGTSGAFTYTPATNFTGRDTFDVRVCDDGTPSLCDDAVVQMTVTPGAVPDAETTLQDTPVVIHVTADDIGDVGPPVVATQPSNGSAAVGPGVAITYTPDAGFVGTDTFTYRVCAPSAPTVCSSALVTVTVQEVIAPLPPNVDDLTVATLTDVPVDGRIPVSAATPDDVLTASVTAPPAHGTISGTQPNGSFTYTPDAGYAGRDHFTAQFCNNAADSLCASGVVTVDVSPVARPVEALTTATKGIVIDVAGNDSGTVGPPTVVTDPANGTATVGSDDQIGYAPTGTFTGTDVFTYRICAEDGSGLCSSADVTVLVEFVATPDLATTSAGRSVLIDVAVDDIGDAQDAEVSAQPSHGSAAAGPGGQIAYTPAGTFTGLDTFEYQRCTATATRSPQCDRASVTVTVIPHLVDDTAETTEQTAVSIDIAGNDFGDGTAATVVQGPAHGTVDRVGLRTALRRDGAPGVGAVRPPATPGTKSSAPIVYTPQAGFIGVDTFVYQRCAPSEPTVCAVANVFVTVAMRKPVVPPTPGGGGGSGGSGGNGGGSSSPTPAPAPVADGGSGSASGGGLADTGFDLLLWLWIAAACTSAGAIVLGAQRATPRRATGSGPPVTGAGR